MFVTGIGIGVLSGKADGAYAAICLFLLPVLVALAGASIITDFGQPAIPHKASVKRAARSRKDASFHLPHAA